MKRSDWLLIVGVLLLLLAFIVISAILFGSVASAQETETSVVHFSVVDRAGNIVADAGRLDVWVKATGEDFQSAPNIGNGGAFTLRRGLEYWAFLGLAPWPDPGFPKMKIIGTEYQDLEATTTEVGPYTSFITVGETGYVTYTVSSLYELFLPAVWLE